MKQCPQCLRSYDDSQVFCLMDGAVLVIEEEQKTIVRQQMPAPKRNKTPFLLSIIAILLLAVIGLTAALFLYKSGGQNETAQSNRQTSATQSPLPSSTPKNTPTANVSNNSTVTNSSPVANSSQTANSSPVADASPKSKEKTTDDETEEIIPISWGSTGMDFKNEPGMTYKFQCPPKGTLSVVIGSDIYMANSSICTAAVHAGIITFEKGGVVTVEYRPGRTVYGSTERNGVKSSTFGEYQRSFVVR